MQRNLLRAKPTMSRASVPTSALSWAVARASDLKAENREAVFDVLLEDKFAERQQVAAGLREAGAHVAVVWEDHTPVAVCTYTVPSGPPRSGRARRELHVMALCIVKAQRRRKLGPALVRLLEHVAAGLGGLAVLRRHEERGAGARAEEVDPQLNRSVLSQR